MFETNLHSCLLLIIYFRVVKMSDKEVGKSHEALQSQKKVPKIMVQRVENMFPALTEGTVSVVCTE
jgi:hypothetical protein